MCKTRQSFIVAFFLTILVTSRCSELNPCNFVSEAENGYSSIALKFCGGLNPITPCIQQRSSASNKLTVRLTRSGQKVWFNVTLSSDCLFRIRNLYYSNDGSVDGIGFYINENIIARYDTQQKSDFGEYWNEFEKTGAIGNQLHLTTEKSYRLIINVTHTDIYGVELDRLETEFLCDGGCPTVLPTSSLFFDDGNSSNNSESNLTNFTIITTILGLVIAFVGLLATIFGLIWKRKHRRTSQAVLLNGSY